MLHIAQARKLIESKEPVDVSFFTKDGELINAQNVVCTSSYFNGNTFNFKWLDSEQFRKVRASLIYIINGEEVYL